MKYNELHKRLRKTGCYPTGKSIAGHPEWYSPLTEKYCTFAADFWKETIKRSNLYYNESETIRQMGWRKNATH